MIAGVGVLLLAMGVGVLIGRAGAGGGHAAPAQVITVGGATSGPAAGGSEAAFAGDWPAGTNGYTVQLQTLPVSGTTVAAVAAAKSRRRPRAPRRRRAAVRRLQLADRRQLRRVCGRYRKRAEAQKALGPCARASRPRP